MTTEYHVVDEDEIFLLGRTLGYLTRNAEEASAVANIDIDKLEEIFHRFVDVKRTTEPLPYEPSLRPI